jgi:hypothetical protein
MGEFSPFHILAVLMLLAVFLGGGFLLFLLCRVLWNLGSKLKK